MLVGNRFGDKNNVLKCIQITYVTFYPIEINWNLYLTVGGFSIQEVLIRGEWGILGHFLNSHYIVILFNVILLQNIN